MKDNQSQFRQYAFQGFLLGLLPLGVLTMHADNHLLPLWKGWAAGALTTVLLLIGVSISFKHRKWGRFFALSGIALNTFVLYFEFLFNPLLTLFCLLFSLAAVYYLFTARLYPAPTVSAALQLERVIGCSSAVVLLSLASPLFAEEFDLFSLACAISLMILLIILGKYFRLRRYFNWRKTVKLLLAVAWAGVGLLTWQGGVVLTAFLTAPAVLIFSLKYKHADLRYLELIVAHPARCLVLTFMGLCIAGTLLLRTPWAMTGELGLLDAAFTSVSAVCVTGLTVINPAVDLTFSGQLFLLLIIQLGGLGIMTLTALALHALGRLSLSGEQLMTELTQSGDQSVFDNLRLIVRFTFTVELIGAILLSWGFFNVHGDLAYAVRMGVFTSISAFCNAGFFLGGESLVPYAGEKLLLTIVACEIVLGGIAPAVTWSFLKMRRYRQLPFISKLVLGVTGFLIVSGTFLLLLFEWNGIFNGLPWHDKIINGFFQSVTLRTAGFNSVPLSNLGVPAYLIMIAWMFIGGSPGGTAGGIKTTTLAVLALIFRAAVRNDEQVIADQHRIDWRNVVQAVAVLIAASLVLIFTVMMLVTTQVLPVKNLVFEAVSALGTVGLSLDCTAELDSVGRLIIMAAMFLGRVGPLTLFCFLSDRQSKGQPGYPQIKIPLA